MSFFGVLLKRYKFMWFVFAIGILFYFSFSGTYSIHKNKSKMIEKSPQSSNKIIGNDEIYIDQKTDEEKMEVDIIRESFILEEINLGLPNPDYDAVQHKPDNIEDGVIVEDYPKQEDLSDQNSNLGDDISIAKDYPEEIEHKDKRENVTVYNELANLAESAILQNVGDSQENSDNLVEEKKEELYEQTNSKSDNASLNEEMKNVVTNKYNNTKPVHIIWTRWRSGSSFLGDFLANLNPITFYSFEPLFNFGDHIFTDEDLPEARKAVKIIQDLTFCKISQNESNMLFHLKHNPMVRQYCSTVHKCNDVDVFQRLCQESERHIVKIQANRPCITVILRVKIGTIERSSFQTVRLGLEFGKEILDSNPQVKILYLIRDPRAVIKSRFIESWCLSDDCKNPSQVCSIDSKDLLEAIILKQTYPDRFIFLRYEDICLESETEFRKILNFLNENYSEEFLLSSIKEFTTIKRRVIGNYNTRGIDSSRHVFQWRDHLNFETMSTIQDSCHSILESVGYRLFLDINTYNDQSVSPLLRIQNL